MRARAMMAVTVAGAAALAAAAGAAEIPPAETLARLDAAAKVIETWPGTFVLTTRATISRTDGSKPERSVSTMRMAGARGGPQVVEVVSATRDGKDVTAKARDDAAKARADAAKVQAGGDAKGETKRDGKGDGKADDDDDGVSLDLPGADSAAKYAFTPLAGTDGSCGAAFAPARDHAGDEGLTRGELHWSCTTLDPLWVSVSPAKNPRGVSEMTLRLEVARTGDTLYVARTVTDGVGGILFIKRRFHVETEISELTSPAPAEAAAR